MHQNAVPPPLDYQAPVAEPEVMATTIKLMDYLHADEVFTSPVQSKQFLNSLSYDDFKRFISLVNGVERDVPISQRGVVGGPSLFEQNPILGEGVQYRPPGREDAEVLLTETLTVAQELDDPGVAGLTLAFAINAIHPFGNGNGRTGRFICALLAKGYDGSPEAQRYFSDILQETKGREVLNPNPAEHALDERIVGDMHAEVERRQGYTVGTAPAFLLGGYDAMPDEWDASNLMVSETISAEDRAMLDNVLNDGGSFPSLSILAVMPREVLTPYIMRRHDGFVLIRGDELIPSLTSEQIRQLAGVSRELKNEYVRRLIHFSDWPDAQAITNEYLDSSLN